MLVYIYIYIYIYTQAYNHLTLQICIEKYTYSFSLVLSDIWYNAVRLKIIIVLMVSETILGTNITQCDVHNIYS